MPGSESGERGSSWQHPPSVRWMGKEGEMVGGRSSRGRMKWRVDFQGEDCACEGVGGV